MRNFRLASIVSRSKRGWAVQLVCWMVAAPMGCGLAAAADLTFNINFVSELDPFPGHVTRYYADVWAENDYAYVGSNQTNGGIAIFELIEDLDGEVHPTYVTTYAGTEMEDVEVHNGIGYFGSDVSITNTSQQHLGTGVDIVNLSDPTQPVFMNRINSADGGHYKVHTLSVYENYLYTADNATDVVRIFNVADPLNPIKLPNLDMGLSSTMDSHEVVARNGRLYVASKDPDDNSVGWTHIFDISNVGTVGPVLLKTINTGGATHTAHATDDNKTLVVAQERSNGEVRIYDISMIDQPSDPDSPVLLKTLTRTSVGIDAYSPHHVMVHGELLFLPWYEAGLQVFNISDPANPLHVGSFDTFAGTSTLYNGNWGVFPDLAFDRVLLSDRTRGLIVVDARDVVPTPDFDKNFAAEGVDFLAWQRGFGKTSNATLAQGDGNRNRVVDGLDLALWRKSFGETEISHGAAAVPEGSTTSMLLISAAALLCRRRAPSQL